jgi:hypothetical protein
MKNFIKQMKTKFYFGDNLPQKETLHGKLYVAYLNKAMIDACAAVSHNTNDSKNNTRHFSASVFKASDGLFYHDSLPIILSHDEEMMLYDEELSEYY